MPSTPCTCNDFPASLGNVTFEAGITLDGAIGGAAPALLAAAGTVTASSGYPSGISSTPILVPPTAGNAFALYAAGNLTPGSASGLGFAALVGDGAALLVNGSGSPAAGLVAAAGVVATVPTVAGATAGGQAAATNAGVVIPPQGRTLGGLPVGQFALCSASALSSYFGGKVGIGTSTPGDQLELASGALLMGGVHSQTGDLEFGAGSAGHYYRLATLTLSGQYDEAELWGTLEYRRSSTAEVGHLPFVLYVKQQGALAAIEPSIGFRYRFAGATPTIQSMPTLLARRTSAAGATPKVISLWVLTPSAWAGVRCAYVFQAPAGDGWQIFTTAQDDGTTAPGGAPPDYVGNEILAINGGNVGIGTTDPTAYPNGPVYALDVNGTVRARTGFIASGPILLPIAAVGGLMDSSGTRRIADENGCYYAD